MFNKIDQLADQFIRFVRHRLQKLVIRNFVGKKRTRRLRRHPSSADKIFFHSDALSQNSLAEYSRGVPSALELELRDTDERLRALGEHDAPSTDSY